VSQQQQNEIAEELKALGFNLKRNIHRRFIVWSGVVGDVEIKKFVTIKAIRAFIAEKKAESLNKQTK